MTDTETPERADPKDTRPLRRVTREQFRRLATGAGWETRTVELFLLNSPPVSKYVGVGNVSVRVTDWPEPIIPVRR